MTTPALDQCPRVLTHMGYAIRKDSLTPEQTLELRKQLTVAPKAATRFAKVGDPFRIFIESASRFYVPRIWGQEVYGPPLASIVTEGEDLRKDLVFQGKPYEYQVAIVQKFLDAGANGLLCVPCGRGKTFMAIQLAARLGKKFLIVVDKEFLLQQWRGELETLLPGIRIGILQEDKKQIHEVEETSKSQTIPELKEQLRRLNLKVTGTKPELLARLQEAQGDSQPPTPNPLTYDCTIAMLQTLVLRDFSDTDFRRFGFTIFDECHHLGAAHFSRALLKVQTKHMLGLSATPTRDDGLTKVFEWFLGKPVYWEKTREADPDVIVRKVEFDSEEPAYANVPVDHMGETILARLLTQVVTSEERNLLIDQLLRDLIKDTKRKILVLSERKSHLERIEQGLPKGTTVGYYIGGMKEEVREEGARTAQVLLGTYAMASEAMNIKTLNTMIMASPRKKIEQSTGRILRVRKDEREVKPLIIDIVDSHDVYQSQWLKRRLYYKKCAYKIEGERNPPMEAPVEGVKEEVRCLIVDD